MTARVAINGFGRVGRLCLRSNLEHHRDHLSVVALNDLADLKTNGDILSKKAERVSSLMSKPLIFVTEDVPVEEIADLMMANKIKRVPVLSGEKLVGIVSRADIIRAIAMGKHIAMHTPIYDL